jgi:hypothetical protein
MIRRSLGALALALATATAVHPQPTFVEVTPQSDPYFVTPASDDFWTNAVAPADVDGDGDLDLAVIGFYVVYNQSVEDRLALLLNQGPGGDGRWSFQDVAVPLGALFAGASDLAWGDYDRDGDVDLAVGSEGATVVYRNDAGTLAALPNPLPGYSEDSSYSGAYDLRSLTWADADNDGDPDLLVPSVYDPDTFSYATKLVRNDGPDGAGGWRFADAGAALDGTAHAQSAWADDDGDGDLDLLLVNVDPYLDGGFIRRYGNAGGVFSGQDLVGVKVEYGLADWSDYDADGDLDLLVVGNIQEVDQTFATVLRLYRNDAGTYVAQDLLQPPSADWLDLHAATWADYDSDGDVDILVTGNHVTGGEIVGKSEIYANVGGTFTPLGVNLPAPESSSGRGGAFTWLDLDGDGDLDYLVSGSYYTPGGNGLVEAQTHLYRNDAVAANLPPTAPAALVAATGIGTAALSWSSASDDHTAGTALTYELEVRRGGGPLLGAARLPEPGNLSAVSSWSLAGLAPGFYTWNVRAVDSAFASGARSQGGFSIPGGLIFFDAFESGSTSAWSGTAF